jgi:hypothetical protein
MKANYSRIPRHTLKTLEKWVAMGRLGDDPFSEAVLMNDLAAAVAHADEANLAALIRTVLWANRTTTHTASGFCLQREEGFVARVCVVLVVFQSFHRAYQYVRLIRNKYQRAGNRL